MRSVNRIEERGVFAGAAASQRCAENEECDSRNPLRVTQSVGFHRPISP